MTENQGHVPYDLEDRTYEFARRVRAFVKRLQRTLCNNLFEFVSYFDIRISCFL